MLKTASRFVSEAPRPRLFYLDLLRIWAITAVLLLHAITPILTNAAFYGSRSWYVGVLLNEFARTGVPLFLMISGSLLLSDARSADIPCFYRKRLPRLLLPLLSWHTIYYFYHVLTGASDASVYSYFSQLFGSGSAYHMWFIYSLLGMYLITPFLKRIADGCSMKQMGLLLLLLLFPGTLRPLWNMTTGFYIFLFDPLMECYFGYFLAGYLLSKLRITPLLRAVYLTAGIGGFLLGFIGNLRASSMEAVTYPFNGGYMLNHYLLAGALFLLVRDLTERHAASEKLSRHAAYLSDITFAIYWVHVIVLEYAQRLIHADTSPLFLCGLHFLTVIICTVPLMAVLSRNSVMRKLLM